MTVDPTVIPGLALLGTELVVLAAVGFVVVRVALRQDDECLALTQGLVVGPALWAMIVSLVLRVVPGLAGAAVGWAIMLAVGVSLAWRSSGTIRRPSRVTAGFLIAFLAVFWMAMASRQTLAIVDPYQTIGVGASIRAGVFPPELSWNPGIPLRYHYGVAMMIGLLAPPSGPDFAFVSEVLGAYCWTGLALVVVAMLRLRGGWLAVAAVAPILITAGAWSWVGPRSLLTVLLPAPTALVPGGVNALWDVYWPSPSLRAQSGALPDIWLPSFTLAYALSLVVLERAVCGYTGSWYSRLTIASLIGFLGLVQTGVVPVVLALWVAIEASHLIRARRAHEPVSGMAVQSGAVVALAALLLVGGGGGLSRVIGGPSTGSVVVETRALSDLRALFGRVILESDGAGLFFQVGSLVVAGVAAALAWRDRLIAVLALGTLVFVLAWAVLDYPPAPWDMGRIAGHGRYFALIALVLALGVGLASLRPRWRYAAAALLALVLVWPTVASPTRNLGMALAHRVRVANAARLSEATSDTAPSTEDLRYAMPGISQSIAEYIRNHTPPPRAYLRPEGMPGTFPSPPADRTLQGFTESHIRLTMWALNTWTCTDFLSPKLSGEWILTTFTPRMPG